MKTDIVINGRRATVIHADDADLTRKVSELEGVGHHVRMLNDRNAAKALLSGGVQGVTLNTADEIEAAVRAPFSDRSYSEIRDSRREANADLQTEYPGIYGGSEVLGSVLIPGFGAGKAAQMGAKYGHKGYLAALAATGGLEGGIAGWGASDADSASGVLRDTAEGAGYGTVLAPALAVGAAGAQRIGGALTDVATNTTERGADRVIGDFLSGANRDDIVERMGEMRGRGMLLDYDDQTLALAGAAADRGHAAPRLLADAVDARQASAQGQVLADIRRASGSTDEGLDAIERRILEEGKAADRVNYRIMGEDAAGMGEVVPLDDELAAFLSTPRVKQHLADVKADWQTDNLTDFDPMSAEIGGAIPLSFINKLKIAMDTKVTKLGNAANPVAGNIRTQTKIRDKIVDKADFAVPEYPHARAAHEKYQSDIEAIETGRGLGSSSRSNAVDKAIAEAEASMGTFTPRQKALYKKALIERMRKDLAGVKADSGDMAGSVYDPNPESAKARRINTLVDDPVSRDRLNTQLDDERRYNESRGYLNLTTQSRTAARQAAGQRADESMGIINQVFGALFEPKSLLRNATQSVLNGGLSPQVADEVARKLLARNVPLSDVQKYLDASNVDEALGDYVLRAMAEGRGAIGGGAALPMILPEDEERASPLL